MPRTRERRNFKPANLTSKLRQVRHGLGLSQSEMVRRLDPEGIMQYGRISEYERGKREPSLWVLLAYARVASIHLEALVDDQIDLPVTLPGNVVYPERHSNQAYLQDTNDTRSVTQPHTLSTNVRINSINSTLDRVEG